MAHVEIKMVNLVQSGTLIDQPISIDCWRATIVFLTDRTGPAASTVIDGVPWDFLYDVNDQYHSQRIELGGAYLNGKPVNIKHDLRFTTDPGVLVPRILLVLQYFVEDGK